MNSLMITSLILSIAASTVVGFATGPPVSVIQTLCRDMVPTGHGDSNAVGEPPYVINVVKETMTRYTVRLEGTGGATFRGFFMQARPWDSGSSSEAQTASIGVFTPGDADRAQALDCFGGTENAWGHNNNTDKSAVEGTWTSPGEWSEVRFRATVVQGPAATYWLELYSDVISADSMTSPMQTTTDSSAVKTQLNLATIFGALITAFFMGLRM